MNWKLSGVGAEPKKLAVLAGLAVVAGYFVFSNSSPGSGSESSNTGRVPVQTMPPANPGARPGRVKRRAAGRDVFEFRPSFKRKDEAVDRYGVDPTLRLDLLERVRDVKMEGVTRSLFDSLPIGPAAAAVVKEVKPITPRFTPQGPPPPPKPVVAVKPPPPPIPLKFYGFIAPASKTGPKRAFFLDGDEIIVAAEGQLIKNRYKIVKIGLNSAIVADTQFESHQQTLALVEEQQGA